MKPTPTDYKGVRYRSKSEAVFARYLDLWLEEDSGIKGAMNNDSRVGIGGFQYEPEPPIGNWNPDFIVWRVFPPRKPRLSTCLLNTMPFLDSEYIEYKPALPAISYLEEWSRKIKQVRRLIKTGQYFSHHISTRFSVFYGSPFSDRDRGRIVFGFNKVSHEEYDWVDYFPSLMDYRFDLKNGGAANGR
jgi:hypothetical protein